MKVRLDSFAAAALLALTLAGAQGCASKDPNAGDAAATTATTGEAGPDPAKKTFTFGTPHVQPGDIAVITTNFGEIRFKFLEDKAPKHVANFEKLADAGFYDGTKFHRVIPGFMIQGGDPNTRGDNRATYGMGDPGFTIRGEFNDTKFVRGIVGMARGADPDSAGSQFFIMVHEYPSLNGKYTAFGQVVSGMDVADKIVNLPRDASDDPNPANPAVVESIKIVHPAAAGGAAK